MSCESQHLPRGRGWPAARKPRTLTWSLASGRAGAQAALFLGVVAAERDTFLVAGQAGPWLLLGASGRQSPSVSGHTDLTHAPRSHVSFCMSCRGPASEGWLPSRTFTDLRWCRGPTPAPRLGRGLQPHWGHGGRGGGRLPGRGLGARVSLVPPRPRLRNGGPRALPPVNTLLPWVSCSLQRVVPELRGDGVAHGPPGRPEGPEPHPRAGADSPVYGRALQGVGPGHHPDGQPEEVSVPGRRAAGGLLGAPGVRPPAGPRVPGTWLWTRHSSVGPCPSGPPRSCV